MTFSPRPLTQLAKLGPFAIAMALLGLVTSGCEDKHIGRVCNLDLVDAGTTATGTNASIQGQAVECPTRICVLPADTNPMGSGTTGPLCSATCSSDSDCDGETTSDKASVQCKSGFTCVIATTVGDFCCEKLCVCKDFVDTTSGSNYNATPTACLPGPTQICQNVH
jgi:hypothetical protein